MFFNWGERLPRGARAFNALYNMESLTNAFTNKCIRFYNLFNVKGLETKDNRLRETW